jgi:hypothetical protein
MSTKLIKNWKEEDITLYKERWKTSNHAELQKIYGFSERTITNINKEFGLKVGVTPGKSYQIRRDCYPVGTIVRHDNTKLGKKLAYIIDENHKRVRLHIYNWLKAGKTIPSGFVLCYIDSKKENPDEVDNLVLKTRVQLLIERRIYKQGRKPKVAKEKIQREIKPKVLKAPKIPKPPKAKKEKKIVTSAISSFHRSIPTIKKKEKSYTTASQDLSKMIPVRVNSKTIVYAKCEEDIPRIMQRFSKTAS